MTGRRGRGKMRGRAERSRGRKGASGSDKDRKRAIATCGVGLLVGVSGFVECVGWMAGRDAPNATVRIEKARLLKRQW